METMDLIRKLMDEKVVILESDLNTNYYGKFLFVKFQDKGGKIPDELIILFGCGFDESISEFVVDWRVQDIINVDDCKEKYLCEINKIEVIEEICKRDRLCKIEISIDNGM